MHAAIKVLDHGYIRLVEAYGHGDAGEDGSLLDDGAGGYKTKVDMECGIIEAARQSTQGNFRGWKPYIMCSKCNGWQDPESDAPNTLDEYCEHEFKDFPKGDEGLLSYLYSGKPQHATPFEFAGGVIEVQAPIFVFREWHRHRTQSYNEMSARYAPLPDLNYVPTKERCFLNSKVNKQAGTIKGAEELNDTTHAQWESDLRKLYRETEEHYQYGLQIGLPKEIARIDLPVGRYSRMRANATLRDWLAFVTLRSDPAAQYEIRQYSDALAQILTDQFPKTMGLFYAKK